jgi:hypothetical protein
VSTETLRYNGLAIEVSERLQLGVPTPAPYPVIDPDGQARLRVWTCARVRGRALLPGSPDLADRRKVAESVQALRGQLLQPDGPLHYAAADGTDLIPLRAGSIVRPSLLHVEKVPGPYAEVVFDVEAGLPVLEAPGLLPALERRLLDRRAELAQAEAARDAHAFTLRAVVAELEALQVEGLRQVADPPHVGGADQAPFIEWAMSTRETRDLVTGGRTKDTVLSFRFRPGFPREERDKVISGALPPMPPDGWSRVVIPMPLSEAAGTFIVAIRDQAGPPPKAV